MTDLLAIEKAVIDALSERYEENVYPFYPDSKKIDYGIYTEIVAFDRKEDDPATGEIDLELSWETRVMLPRDKDNYQKARDKAVDISYFINNNQFGINQIIQSKFLDASDDNLDKQNKNIESWLVQWVQMVRVGEPRDDVLHEFYELEGEPKGDVHR